MTAEAAVWRAWSTLQQPDTVEPASPSAISLYSISSRGSHHEGPTGPCQIRNSALFCPPSSPRLLPSLSLITRVRRRLWSWLNRCNGAEQLRSCKLWPWH